ncbi:MAG: hypothetical protein H0Z32_10500 [Bacillaceae bacterium]|nr:hypothetical protein [Bacillaceae bacterium]
MPTEEPAAVVIYQDPKDEQQMYGFLNYKSQYYSLGSVSSYGLDDVTIKEQDVTCDSTPELIIQGSQGASYREIQIMLYDEQNEKWLRVLKTGSPRFADLNGDGKRELLSVSTGTNPPYVWIYEWEEDHFQMADVAEAVGGNAAILKKRDGQWVIEVYDNGDQRLYQYNHGNLISVE